MKTEEVFKWREKCIGIEKKNTKKYFVRFLLSLLSLTFIILHLRSDENDVIIWNGALFMCNTIEQQSITHKNIQIPKKHAQYWKGKAYIDRLGVILKWENKTFFFIKFMLHSHIFVINIPYAFHQNWMEEKRTSEKYIQITGEQTVAINININKNFL